MDFEDYQRQNPGHRFSDYYVYKLKTIIDSGEAHGALGRDLYRDQKRIDFEEAGRQEFESLVARFGIQPAHRVVDFGCGSLRLGVHFIRYLDPGNYYGLDLTDDFIIPGLERVSEILGAERVFKVGLIGRDLEDAVAFGPDLVVSSNVAYHVHPDECAEFHERLLRLTAKPGARLVFDSRVAADPHRFGDRNWAFAADFHQTALADLSLVNTVPDARAIDMRLAEGAVARVIYCFARA